MVGIPIELGPHRGSKMILNRRMPEEELGDIEWRHQLGVINMCHGTISPITQFMAHYGGGRMERIGGHNPAAFLHSPLEGIPCHQLKRRYLPPINIQGWGRERYLVQGGRRKGRGSNQGHIACLPSPRRILLPLCSSLLAQFDGCSV